MTSFALVDCNNFFVSCEKVFRPELEGQPVVVLSSNDGCIIARSNEAKALGIKMGEPAFKCRDILTAHKVKQFSSNFALYSDMSNRVFHTLRDQAPKIEIYSVDEAFLDFSHVPDEHKLAEAERIQSFTQKSSGIPVTIGVAPTKTLAKIATEFGKRIGQRAVEITDTNRESILRRIAIRDVWGIGRRYSEKLQSHGLRTAYDLSIKDDNWVRKNMTVLGLRTVLELRGESCIALNQSADPKKSILSSRTFSKSTSSLVQLQEAVATYISIAARKLREQNSLATQLAVSVRNKTNNFSHKIPIKPTQHTAELIKQAHYCLDQIYNPSISYKKAAVYLSGLLPGEYLQEDLFEPKDHLKESQISATVDHLNCLLGRDTIVHASAGLKKEWTAKCNLRSPRYTTSWQEVPVAKV